MAKTKEPVITVNTIFAGKQTGRQAFMDLILYKREMLKTRIDYNDGIAYTGIIGNCSGIRKIFHTKVIKLPEKLLLRNVGKAVCTFLSYES